MQGGLEKDFLGGIERTALSLPNGGTFAEMCAE